MGIVVSVYWWGKAPRQVHCTGCFVTEFSRKQLHLLLFHHFLSVEIHFSQDGWLAMVTRMRPEIKGLLPILILLPHNISSILKKPCYFSNIQHNIRIGAGISIFIIIPIQVLNFTRRLEPFFAILHLELEILSQTCAYFRMSPFMAKKGI